MYGLYFLTVTPLCKLVLNKFTAFIKNSTPLLLEIGNMGFDFTQFMLGRFAAAIKIVEGILDILTTTTKIVFDQFARKVPEDAKENNEIDNTVSKISPAVLVPLIGQGFRGEETDEQGHVANEPFSWQ